MIRLIGGHPTKLVVVRLIKGVLGILVAISIFGCASKPKEIVVTKTEYQMVDIPSTYLDISSVTAPPDKATFINASSQTRVDLLISYSKSLLGDVAKLQSKLRAITTLQKEQRKAIEQRMKP